MGRASDFSRSAFLLISILLGGCAKEQLNDCITSTGPDRTHRVDLPAFKRLYINDNVQVILQPDTVDFVEWQAGRNLLKQLSAKVENEQLLLSNQNTCNWVRSSKRDIKAVIHFTQLDHIIHDGFGKISSAQTLSQPYLRLDVTDAGDIEVSADVKNCLVTLYETGQIRMSGKVNLLQVENYGYGSVFAREMIAQTVFGKLVGYGEVHVRATDNLGVNISGATDLHFYGQPAHIDTTRKAGASGHFIFHP